MTLPGSVSDRELKKFRDGGSSGPVVAVSNADGSPIGTSGVGEVDESAFTEGASLMSLIGGVFNDSLGVVSSGIYAALRMTASRALHINLRDSSGNESGTSTNPVQVTQAALVVGVDTVSAGPMVPFSIAITGNGAAQQIIVAPAANTHIRIFKLVYDNAAAVVVTPGVRNGSGGTNNAQLPLSANIGDAKSAGPSEGYIPLTGGATPSGLYSSNFAAGAGTIVQYEGVYTVVADNTTDTTIAALW